MLGRLPPIRQKRRGRRSVTTATRAVNSAQNLGVTDVPSASTPDRLDISRPSIVYRPWSTHCLGSGSFHGKPSKSSANALRCVVAGVRRPLELGGDLTQPHRDGGESACFWKQSTGHTCNIVQLQGSGPNKKEKTSQNDGVGSET